MSSHQAELQPRCEAEKCSYIVDEVSYFCHLSHFQCIFCIKSLLLFLFIYCIVYVRKLKAKLWSSFSDDNSKIFNSPDILVSFLFVCQKVICPASPTSVSRFCTSNFCKYSSLVCFFKKITLQGYENVSFGCLFHHIRLERGLQTIQQLATIQK